MTPFNSRGWLLVHVDLATFSATDPDVEMKHMVTLRFLTDYAAIAGFADSFQRVLDGAKDRAILEYFEH